MGIIFYGDNVGAFMRTLVTLLLTFSNNETVPVLDIVTILKVRVFNQC